MTNNTIQIYSSTVILGGIGVGNVSSIKKINNLIPMACVYWLQWLYWQTPLYSDKTKTNPQSFCRLLQMAQTGRSRGGTFHKKSRFSTYLSIEVTVWCVFRYSEERKVALPAWVNSFLRKSCWFCEQSIPLTVGASWTTVAVSRRGGRLRPGMTLIALKKEDNV